MTLRLASILLVGLSVVACTGETPVRPAPSTSGTMLPDSRAPQAVGQQPAGMR